MIKVKIIYVILNGVPYGGSEKHVIDIYNYISSTNSDVKLIYSKGNSMINRIINKENTFAVGRGMFDFIKILKIIKDERPDIVHAHAARALIFSRLIKFFLKFFFSCEFKLISTSHGLWLPPLKRKLQVHRFMHFMKNQDNLTLAVSSFSRKELIEQGYDKNNIKYIYNGIDFDCFNSCRKIKNKVNHVCFIGRLTEQKGISYLMELILYENKLKSNIKFSIYGTGHLDVYIEDFISKYKLDNVELKGHTENIQDVFYSSDLLIAPSVDEGLPYTLVEAINSGLPIISTRVGGVPEIVENEVNGFIIEPGDQLALNEAFTRIKEETLESMSKESIRISNKFSLKIMLDNINKEYKELLK